MSALFEEIQSKILASKNLEELEKNRLFYLGKNGLITLQLKDLVQLTLEERVIQGKALNEIRSRIEALIDQKKSEFNEALLQQKLQSESVDVSLPPRTYKKTGTLHPVSLTIKEIEDYFSRLGFQSFNGPEIETTYYNFDALNIPAHHPARQSHDTFFIGEKLLRTHTSPIQIRTMEKQQPPLRILSCGRAYRNDSIDATHSPMFHQFEILAIDKNITMSHLKGCLLDFCRYFFDDPTIEVCFRPSFFPFTEPSAEIDMKKDGKWLEMGGCGMVHPNVLKNCKIDPGIWQGFAWGCGIERFIMVKYGIDDIRDFYTNDIGFLNQFYFL